MAKKTYQLISLESELTQRFGELSPDEITSQMNNLISVLDLDPTIPDISAEQWKSAISILDVVLKGQAPDFEQAKAFLASDQMNENGHLEQSIEIRPQREGLISTINRQGDSLYDDIPHELAVQQVHLKGAIGNAILGRLDQRLQEGGIDEKIEAEVKKLESQQTETFEDRLTKILGLPPSG